MVKNEERFHLVYVHQYFKTPEEGGATRSYYIAKNLVERGLKVTLISRHNESKKILKNVDGIKVLYLPISYSNSFTYYNRIRTFFSFTWKTIFGIRRILKTENIDQLFLTSTPLTVGIIGFFFQKINSKKIPYLFEVRDLWPLVPIKMGILKNKILIQLSLWLEKSIYQSAEKIIALSKDIQHHIVSIDNRNENKTILITNFCHTKFWSDCISNPVERHVHINQKNESQKPLLNILYPGAFGVANGLDFLLEGIFKLRHTKYYNRIHLTLIGEGAQEKHLKHKVVEMGLIERISILPFENSFALKQEMKKAQAIFVCYTDVDILGTGSPNKFFDGLSAGKIILHNTSCWINDLVNDNAIGFKVTENNWEYITSELFKIIESQESHQAYINRSLETAQFFEFETQMKLLHLPTIRTS